MLFERRFWAGIGDGSITCTFRRWRSNQAVAGRRYRTAAGIIAVSAVDVVPPEAITDEEAHDCGYASADELRADLRGDPALPLRRVRFRIVDEPDPRVQLAATDDLSAEDIAEISGRLARLDRASRHGPWARETLALIAAKPGVRAGDLADAVGRDRHDFKLDVRKLKNLGLTESLPVGYRLSPRGIAYLDGAI